VAPAACGAVDTFGWGLGQCAPPGDWGALRAMGARVGGMWKGSSAG
jgi:hypothetical protein